MATERKARFTQPCFPPVPGPDRRRLIQQPVFFLLFAQAGEPGVERVILGQERLLAMENRWVGVPQDETHGRVENLGRIAVERISQVELEGRTIPAPFRQANLACRQLSNSCRSVNL